MGKNKLSQSTREKLGHYVYFLVDPRNKGKNGGVFYVGKGYGERALAHLKYSVKKEGEKKSKKSERIKEIRKSGKEAGIDILRHGITSKEAFEVESAVIDFIGKENLTNKVLGHDSSDRGKMSLDELEIKYKAKKAKFKDDLLLININRTFKRGMSSREILKVTKGNWKTTRENANNYKLVCAVFRGIIREVFAVEKWFRLNKGNRIFFKGGVASEKIRKRYIHKNVSNYQSQNPIRYINGSLKN